MGPIFNGVSFQESSNSHAEIAGSTFSKWCYKSIEGGIFHAKN